MSERTPEISVILPAYNAEPFLDIAITSILEQGFGDFELILIDDGSSDGTWEVIERFRREDSRISAIKNPENLGLIRTLNRGLEQARGRYIARQDADDISLSHRFETQVAYFEHNLEVGIVGSAMEVIDEQGKYITSYRQPETDMQIRFRLLFNCPFVHTSVMIRRSLLERFDLRYDVGFPHAEDYELWSRIMEHSQGYNFQTPLVKYRLIQTSVSVTNASAQIDMADRISNRQIESLGSSVIFSAADKAVMLELYRKFLIGELVGIADRDAEVLGALYNLMNAFLLTHGTCDARLQAFKAFLEARLESNPEARLYNMLMVTERAMTKLGISEWLKAKFPNAAYKLRDGIRAAIKK
ncbi:MAG: glycosyltransferase [Desulfuromusa sp.]|nr:glycosyltransferase [Desulfuromusa sp.]